LKANHQQWGIENSMSSSYAFWAQPCRLPPKPLALATNSRLKKGIKDMKTKLSLILMLSCFFCLIGCQSEVDKCTNAFVKKGADEAGSRLVCLEAATGKQ
jgi:hypothetical protein